MKNTAVDLFCGAGGLSAGLEMAGFRVLAGVDMFEVAGKSFEASHPHATFIGKPIEEVSSEELLETTGLLPGELTILAGGPPCQAYSVYNHKRGMHDERASLFREYLRIVKGVKPQWIVMENVMGIYSIGGGEAVQAIKSELNKLGYHVEEKILKAEDYGVPQERRRVVFIGNCVGSPVRHPEPTHGEGLRPFTTIKEAIGDLPKLNNGEVSQSARYSQPATGEFRKYVRAGSKRVANHSCPKLGKVNLDRMKHIPAGGSWRDIPFELLPAGMKRAKRSDHTKRYGRMTWDGLSCTVLTKCDVHWGAYIHPEQDRAISIREAARLQAFPDSFEFYGSRTDQYIQVGNAVPPLLGKAIGETIKSLADQLATETIAAE